MFIENKYKYWYDRIIDKARKRRRPTEYFERHHIIPRCMGGDNKWLNVVRLTFREHYLVHWLLTKCVKGQNLQKKMNLAFASMIRSGKCQTSWRYEKAKTAARIAKFGNKHFLGKTHSEENKIKQRELMLGNRRAVGNKNALGYKHTSEARARIGAASSARKRSNETKIKMSSIMRGKKHTEETKRKLSTIVAAWHANRKLVEMTSEGKDT